MNDGSTDRTRLLLDRLDTNNVRVIHRIKNRGKGAAIRLAKSHVKGDLVLIQDADSEYDPVYYQELLKPFESNSVKTVYGSRFLGSYRGILPLSLIANHFLTSFANMLFDIDITDMETGFKVFRRDLFCNLTWKSNRFDFDPEVTAVIAKRGHHIYEVPIDYCGRNYKDGKKIRWTDGIKAIICLLRVRFSR